MFVCVTCLSYVASIYSVLMSKYVIELYQDWYDRYHETRLLLIAACWQMSRMRPHSRVVSRTRCYFLFSNWITAASTMILDNNASSGAIKDIPQLNRLVVRGMNRDACKAYGQGEVTWRSHAKLRKTGRKSCVSIDILYKYTTCKHRYSGVSI